MKKTAAVRAHLLIVLVAVIPISSAVAQEQKSCLSSPTAVCLLKVAKNVAEAIESESERVLTLSSIATKQAAVGDRAGARKTIALALQTLREIKSAMVRALALPEIAKAQATVDDKIGARDTLAQALQAARAIDYAFLRYGSLYEIVKVQSEAGDIAGALKTTQAIEDAYFHAAALCETAVVLSKIK